MTKQLKKKWPKIKLLLRKRLRMMKPKARKSRPKLQPPGPNSRKMKLEKRQRLRRLPRKSSVPRQVKPRKPKKRLRRPGLQPRKSRRRPLRRKRRPMLEPELMQQSPKRKPPPSVHRKRRVPMQASVSDKWLPTMRPTRSVRTHLLPLWTKRRKV